MPLHVTLFAAALGMLTACDRHDGRPAAAAIGTRSVDAGVASASLGGRRFKGVGLVTAVDVSRGCVTIRHEPIPELGWPQMTMGFLADPVILGRVRLGARVAFEGYTTTGRTVRTSVRPS